MSRQFRFKSKAVVLPVRRVIRGAQAHFKTEKYATGVAPKR